jgi:hypothetical protein
MLIYKNNLSRIDDFEITQNRMQIVLKLSGSWNYL